jgi:NADPH-dependent 2,4-dienoyl-CoA reductase/sulfur reductase-like enzyme
MREITTDVVVIGGGPAGLAAALEAAKSGVRVLILERDFALGGILQQCIHNGFGLRYFKEELTGPEYAQRFIDQLTGTGIEVLCGTMVIDLKPDKTIAAVNKSDGVVTIKSRAIVLAMGCRERSRGAINIPGDRCAGVFPAGLSQRFVNMEGYMPARSVVIVGSGDIGMIMARRLTLEGATVKAVVEVLPYAAGLVRNRVQCLEDYNIPLFLCHTVTHIHGKDRVEGVTISQVDDKWRPLEGTSRYVECDTVLFSVGLIPENELSQKAGIELSSTGGPVVNELCETSVPGIFAAGNVLQVHDLVDWVTLEAQRAGNNAAQCVIDSGKPRPERQRIRVIPGGNVGYAVPQFVDYLAPDTRVQFSFRPKAPEENMQVRIESGGQVLAKRNRPRVIPSEMINVTTRPDPSLIKDKEITLRIVPQPEGDVTE